MAKGLGPFTRLGLYGGPRRLYGSFACKSESIVVVHPVDRDDQDNSGNTLTITAFVDGDGVTVRAPRVTLLHAFDDSRNDALVGPDRLELDTFSGRSNRSARLPNYGRSMRLRAFSSRAGEAFAPRNVAVGYSVRSGSARIAAVDTTNRTDDDGVTLAVPTIQIRTAADSSRNAALAVSGTDQDRHYTRHDVEYAVGASLRVVVENLGRAGDAGGAPARVILGVSVRQNSHKARST